jgi:hypothetical protein
MMMMVVMMRGRGCGGKKGGVMLTLLGCEKEKSSERGEALEPSNKHPPQYAVIPSQREPLVQPYAAEKASECECDAHQMVKPASAMGCEQGWHYWQPLYAVYESYCVAMAGGCPQSRDSERITHFL